MRYAEQIRQIPNKAFSCFIVVNVVMECVNRCQAQHTQQTTQQVTTPTRLNHTHLCSMSHCVEGEEIVFSDLELVPEVLQSGLQ